MRQLSSNALIKRALNAQTITANANGTGIDVRGFDRGTFLVSVGTLTGTAPTVDVKLQDSADNSAFADVAGATFAQITGANSPGVFVGEADLTKLRRYVRLVFTTGGTSPGAPVSATAILHRGTTVLNPPAQDAAVKTF